MADDAERDGGHRVRQARGGPRPRRADAHPAGQSHGAREGGDEQQADPQPLNYPPPDGKQPEQLEERPHREQVADRLIQQPAELLRIPQSKRAGQKAGRVDHELELGVRDDVARRGRERDRGQEQAAREQSEPDRESMPALPPRPAPGIPRLAAYRSAAAPSLPSRRPRGPGYLARQGLGRRGWPRYLLAGVDEHIEYRSLRDNLDAATVTMRDDPGPGAGSPMQSQPSPWDVFGTAAIRADQPVCLASAGNHASVPHRRGSGHGAAAARADRCQAWLLRSGMRYPAEACGTETPHRRSACRARQGWNLLLILRRVR